jgi:hypothetical protein
MNHKVEGLLGLLNGIALSTKHSGYWQSNLARYHQPVAWQVNQKPGVVDQEVVDELSCTCK